MDLQLAGHAALVTAASRGLGRASAVALANEGVKVAVGSRSIKAVEELAAEIRTTSRSGEAFPLTLDLRSEADPAEAVRAVVDRWGQLDILVVNAPGPPALPVLEASDEQWVDAWETLVMSAVRLVRAAGNTMVRQGGGRIVFISTIGVRTVQPEMVLSNATRLATLGLAKAMALELAEHNVFVNVVAPGPIDGDRMDELASQTAGIAGISPVDARQRWIDEIPLRRMGSPNDVGSLVAYLASPVCGFTTGAVVPVDGGKARAY